MRLIDADEVKKKLRYIYEHEKDVINSIWRLNTLVDKVDEIPTAYDLDKMLKQLKEVAIEKNDYVGMGGEKTEIIKIMKLAEKLKEYEDAEEQGRLLKLPCKEAYTQTGDTVYLIYENEIIECIHCGLSISTTEGKGYITLCTDKNRFLHKIPDPKNASDSANWYTDSIDAEVDEIGKMLFFTREAAEQALKQMMIG